jgi:methanogenic corrinoid protein MtbC1
MYGEGDVALVERILQLLEEGHSLTAITQVIKNGRSEALEGGGEPDRVGGVWHDYLKATLTAIQDFSHERIEAVFNEASSLYPLDMITERLIEPVLHELGRNWQGSDTGIAEEHFYTNWVRNRLGARFHHAYSQVSGARIICACLPGSYHDIGLMLFSLSAMTRGYRVLYLGADLPLEQIAAVVRRSGARGVVLSARLRPDAVLEQRLAGLAQGLSVPVLLGGRAADEALAEFEAAGGVRIGSRMAIALQVMSAHIAVYSGGRVHDRRKQG